MELDVYAKSKSLAIEYHGLHWHSLACHPKHIGVFAAKHVNKYLKCMKAGIDLIQFWDYEWDTKQDICKSIINARLGLLTRIPARNTVAKVVPEQDAKLFLAKNHLQGARANVIEYLGLYQDNQLLSLLAVSKNRFGGPYAYEISRHANLLNTSVQGGLSKLIKFACSFIFKPGDQIIDYTDLRIFRGNTDGCGHPRVGFVSLKRSKPTMYYYHAPSQKVFHGSKFRGVERCGDAGVLYSSMKDKYQQLEERGYYRFWDAGKLYNILTIE